MSSTPHAGCQHKTTCMCGSCEAVVAWANGLTWWPGVDGVMTEASPALAEVSRSSPCANKHQLVSPLRLEERSASPQGCGAHVRRSLPRPELRLPWADALARPAVRGVCSQPVGSAKPHAALDEKSAWRLHVSISEPGSGSAVKGSSTSASSATIALSCAATARSPSVPSAWMQVVSVRRTPAARAARVGSARKPFASDLSGCAFSWSVQAVGNHR